MDYLVNLYRINRWWSSGKVDPPFLYRIVRDEFKDIYEKLDNRRILSLIGPRRVGKSTLMYQTIDFLLRNNIKPKQILLFSGDDPGLFSSNETITDILELYSKEVLSQNLEDVKEKIYVFIDEIHFIENWQLYLKSFYERRYNIKFIISGSSSIHLFKDSKESLMGRIEDIYILPLELKQYIRFYNEYIEKINIDEFNSLMPNFKLFDDYKGYYKCIIENKYKIIENENSFNKVIKSYLLVGGYPEFFEVNNVLLWQRRLADDIISKGLYRDIVSIYNIKNPEILEKLMYLISFNNGGEYSYASIAKTLNIDTVTVSSYINYLSQAFFVIICDNYSTNVGKIIRKNKKLYIADMGIQNALLKNDTLSIDIGLEIENCCMQIAKKYCEHENYDTYFWRENQKETDIVIDKKVEVLPIEVKYRNSISDKDLSGLFVFMDKFKTKEGIVITKDYLNYKDNIYYIPFWLVQ